MRRFYDTETGITVTEKMLRDVWEEEFTDEERAEYGYNFGWYLSACMTYKGGTLQEI